MSNLNDYNYFRNSEFIIGNQSFKPTLVSWNPSRHISFNLPNLKDACMRNEKNLVHRIIKLRPDLINEVGWDEAKSCLHYPVTLQIIGCRRSLWLDTVDEGMLWGLGRDCGRSCSQSFKPNRHKQTKSSKNLIHNCLICFYFVLGTLCNETNVL